MKKHFLILLFVFAIGFVFLSVSITEQNSVVPKFKDYPANDVYIGEPAAVILSTKDENLYRTRLREASKQSINFAGEYVLTTWGCGTDCLQGAVVSLKTGRVVFLPGTICCWKGDGGKLLFRVNSHLLVAAGIINENSEHGAHFYEFTGNEFKHISTIPVAEKSGDTNSSSSPPLLTEQEKTNIVQQEKQIESQQQIEKTPNPTQHEVSPGRVDPATIGQYKGIPYTATPISQEERDAQYESELELRRNRKWGDDVATLIGILFLSVVGIGILIVGVQWARRFYKSLKVEFYIALGVDAFKNQDLDKATRFLEQGLVIAQEIERKKAIVTICGVLGGIHQTRGEFDQAEKMYEQSLVYSILFLC